MQNMPPIDGSDTDNEVDQLPDDDELTLRREGNVNGRSPDWVEDALLSFRQQSNHIISIPANGRLPNPNSHLWTETDFAHRAYNLTNWELFLLYLANYLLPERLRQNVSPFVRILQFAQQMNLTVVTSEGPWQNSFGPIAVVFKGEDGIYRQLFTYKIKEIDKILAQEHQSLRSSPHAPNEMVQPKKKRMRMRGGQHVCNNTARFMAERGRRVPEPAYHKSRAPVSSDKAGKNELASAPVSYTHLRAHET